MSDTPEPDTSRRIPSWFARQCGRAGMSLSDLFLLPRRAIFAEWLARPGVRRDEVWEALRALWPEQVAEMERDRRWDDWFVPKCLEEMRRHR